VRRSIVSRTTFAILILSLILGLAFASVVSSSVDHREQQRAQVRVEQLLLTVERTAQIACYLKDRSLATEIAEGLMRNRAVSGVSITSGDETLARVGNTTVGNTTLGRSGSVDNSQVTRHIYSPFDTRDAVGDVTLFVNRADIHAEASSYSRAATLAMALQVALVAAGVAVAVYFFSTRPMKAVSNELHRIRFDTTARLRVPPSNRLDEIGTLVTDVNSLIASLAGLLTTERELRIAHEMSERKMRLIFEKSETGLFVLDERGALESWNPAFIRLLRLPPDRPLQAGSRLQELLAPHAARLDELVTSCLLTGQSHDIDLEIELDGGQRSAWIEVALKPIGQAALQGIINDITERKQGELSAQELATQDTLTGLLNRRGLDRGLAAAFSRHAPGAAPELALLQIDLDYFKQVNDVYGHHAGDQVLRYVAKALQRNTRRGDLIARPGGDEFVVALVGIADAEKAEQIARAIVAEVHWPIDVGGHSVQIGASIGIAFASTEVDSPEALLRRADDAMYSAKKAGRGQVCLASTDGPAQTSAVA
jgi:diguanylate cyclase (GGDEF)-like protein/PAS domain S-box-containing protein